MGDGLKVAPRRRVREDLFAQRASIERAIGQKHGVAEAHADGVERWSAWCDDLARDDIAIDHRDAACFE